MDASVEESAQAHRAQQPDGTHRIGHLPLVAEIEL
jgi:hypothetical protein